MPPPPSSALMLGRSLTLSGAGGTAAEPVISENALAMDDKVLTMDGKTLTMD